MKVIIAFTFCCNNLWKSKFMALEKPGKIGIFSLLLCGHPVEFVVDRKSGPREVPDRHC